MKDAKGARQQSTVSNRNIMNRRQIVNRIYKNCHIGYDFTKTHISLQEQENIVNNTIDYFLEYAKNIKKPYINKVPITRALNNGNKFICCVYFD